MLGFDAIGRLALGELPSDSAQNVVLVADSGSYTITGHAIGGPLSMVAGSGSYLVTGSAAHLLAKADSGAYALTGAGVALAVRFIAAPGTYAVTGHPVVFGTDHVAEPGQYSVTGNPAQQRFATGTGHYTVSGSDAFTRSRFTAERGAYTVTLGAFELRRTGYDWPPDQYGIGHIKLAMVEARRRAVVIKPPPRPVVSRLPALPQYRPQAPTVAPVAGLVGDTSFVDRLEAQRREQAARAEELRKQQVRNRAIATLLLAA